MLADELPLPLAHREQHPEFGAPLADLQRHDEPEDQCPGEGDHPDDQAGEGADPLDRADLVAVRLVVDAEVEPALAQEPFGLGVQLLGTVR